MNQQQQASREELVDKYFVPIPVPPTYGGPLAAVVGGAVLLLVALVSVISASAAGGSDFGAGAGCLGCLGFVGGLPAVIWGGLNMVRRATAYSAARARAFPRAEGRWMDQWLEEGLRHASTVAPGRVNRHPGEQTLRWGVDTLLFVGSPPLRDYPVQFAYGHDDGKLRSSLHKILIVFLSDYRVSTYECVLDMRTGAMVSDATKEYHLQHVDGIETASDRISMMFPNQPQPNGVPAPAAASQAGPVMVDEGGRVAHITTTQTLSLMVAGRRAVELVMGISRSERLQIEGIQNPSSPDAMIHTLREHLRNHNGGATAPAPHAMPTLPPMPPPVDRA